MTPEEACEYLGISLDDDLTVELLESRYQAKLSECGGDQARRAKIEEAGDVLVDLYANCMSQTAAVSRRGTRVCS